MLKRRIIPIQLLSKGRLVKTSCFSAPLDVGDPVQSSKVYSDQDADELLLLQIGMEMRSVASLVDVVVSIAEKCFVPLTVGGGIVCLEDAVQLISSGADKIVLNSIAYEDYSIITSIAERFGSQAVVVGIDVRKQDEEYVLFSHCGTRKTNISLELHIASIVQSGAGELIIQSIDRDGMRGGYDIELLKRVVDTCPLPIIGAAGAGNFMHLKEAFDVGIDATACGSLFNFGDNSPLRAKAFLKNYGVPLKNI